MSRSLVVDITISQGYILKSAGKRKLKDFSFTGRPFVRKLVSCEVNSKLFPRTCSLRSKTFRIAGDRQD